MAKFPHKNMVLIGHEKSKIKKKRKYTFKDHVKLFVVKLPYENIND